MFIHAKDVALGMKLVTEKYPKADPVNIGNDNEITIKALVEKIQKLTGIYNPVFYNTAMPEGYPRRAANTTKLKQVTEGFVPRISIEQGLTEMIEFFRKKLAKGDVE